MKNYEQIKLNKVEAQNKCHMFLNDLVPQLRDWLEPFVGTAIIKVDGDYMRKVVDSRPQFSKVNFRWWTTHSSFSIRVNGSYSISDANGTVYADAEVYVAELASNHLIKTYPRSDPLKTDYNKDEIEMWLKNIAGLQKQIDAIKSQMGPFRDGISVH